LRFFFALALAVAIAAFALEARPQTASASGGGLLRVTDVEFTKWVTDATSFPWPMVGVVTGGDLGGGSFNGQVLSLESSNGISRVKADYGVDADRDFTARVHVRQNDATGHAVLAGIITHGWRRGALVLGEYDTLAVCDRETPGNVFPTPGSDPGVCFQVTLHIIGGFGN
jgi:hypothetical protein